MHRYAIWWEKGYQEFDSVVSSTTTKLKGIAQTNYTDLKVSLSGGHDGIRIWDVADYVVPPQVHIVKSWFAFLGPYSPTRFRTTIKLNRAVIGRRHGNVCYFHDVGQIGSRFSLIEVLNFVGEYGPKTCRSLNMKRLTCNW